MTIAVVRNVLVPKHFITMLLPTRKRTVMVKKSVSGLLELANDPRRINIAVAYDDDDSESEQYFSSNAWKLLVENTGATQQVHQIQRLGWTALHEYYNYLAQQVDSEWYFIWNDDAFMQTQGWDQEIFDNRAYNSLISMESNELSCYTRINAKIFHDHFQFTGNNNDEVYQETSKNKKFTKRAYKTDEMSELKQSWIAQWKEVLDAK